MKNLLKLPVLIILFFSILNSNASKNRLLIGDESGKSSGSNSGVSFVLKIQPLSLLLSPDMDGFQVYREDYDPYDPYGYSYFYNSESIEGIGSLLPTINAGVGIRQEIVFLDFTLGMGYFYNGALQGIAPNFDFAARFRPAKVFTIGAHTTIFRINPKWTGAGYSDDNDVDLSSFTGFSLGPTLTVGKTANFVFSLDYFIGESDVTTYNVWRANYSTINFSGIMVNFGFLLRVPYK